MKIMYRRKTRDKANNEFSHTHITNNLSSLCLFSGSISFVFAWNIRRKWSHDSERMMCVRVSMYFATMCDTSKVLKWYKSCYLCIFLLSPTIKHKQQPSNMYKENKRGLLCLCFVCFLFFIRSFRLSLPKYLFFVFRRKRSISKCRS